MTTQQSLPRWMKQALMEDHRNLVFSSTAAEETRTNVANIFKSHHLEPLSHGGKLSARLHSVALGCVSYNRLAYGGAVRIDPERLEHFYLIQMPLQGQARIDNDGEQIDSGQLLASVLNPTARLRMHYSEDCDQLMLRIEREALEHACSRFLGRPLRAPLSFHPVMYWRDTPSWFNLIGYITRLLKESPEAHQDPLIAPQLEQLIIHTLLTTQPHNYSDALRQGDKRLAPRHVKRVEEYIEAHAQEPLTPAQLASVAGVSLRTLYAGFRDFRHQSPMETLRQVRLERVRQALLTGTNTATITDIAMGWGFTHMGRFSLSYRQVFGESPSETLRSRCLVGR
ncbi:AraC family transcriptional regulator [Halomonas sp. XH26]|uniref:AraC family transcriptional regulator n=1 Tax=Halomonas sp. XH26 TaxID=2557993 RepID=UPI00209F19CD|nr:AraC family transcriptional regulator [Halomonas sp. XH26]UTA79833.1 AraC family transcriptional regulator [Halomonas sp. XH26]